MAPLQIIDLTNFLTGIGCGWIGSQIINLISSVFISKPKSEWSVPVLILYFLAIVLIGITVALLCTDTSKYF